MRKIGDNIWFDRKRVRLATNLDRLRRTHSLIAANGHAAVPPRTFWTLLALEEEHRHDGRKAS